MLELLIRVASTDADVFSAILFDSGLPGFEERDEPPHTCFVLYGVEREELAGIQHAIAERANGIELCAAPAFELCELPDAEANAWTEHLEPEWLTDTIVIQPASHPLPEDDTRVIRYEPDLAFGSGGHSTTRLAARAVARAIEAAPDSSLLDVGTGNGVLVFVAIACGARSALGIDIDQRAVDNARRNAELNGLTESCRFETFAVTELNERFDVVVANIDAATLATLATVLCARTLRSLVLTGLLVEQRPEVEACYTALGMRLADSKEQGEWCLLEFAPPLTKPKEL